MFLNLPSKIILNILVPGIESFIKDNSKPFVFSISPVMSYEEISLNNINSITYKFEAAKKEINITLFSHSFSDDLFMSFKEWFNNQADDIKMILSLLLKNNINVEIAKENAPPQESEDIKIKKTSKKRIDVSWSSGEDLFILSTVIPDDFFKHLLRKKNTDGDNEKIEEEILDFFMNPFNIFPGLKTVLDSLNDLELQKLLYKLQKNNLLTTYQLCLLVRSFPEHSLRIKRNISKNRIGDVTAMLNKLSGSKSITKRDLIEGIYSIEEALFMLMKKNEDTNFSKTLSDIFNDIKKFVNVNKILRKDFSFWIKEMRDSDLLQQTISTMKEDDIARAVSNKAEYYFGIFRDFISEKKIRFIQELINSGGISYSDTIEAQYNFIINYRKQKIKRLSPGPEKFRVLITRMKGMNGIMHLLTEVGWFTLATAFKTEKSINENQKKRIISLFDNCPAGARYLIIDVLNGTVNPDIIHDEMQINKARNLCVREIASLYEDGIIEIF